MTNGSPITTADFEKAFEEMYKAGVDNNQAIVFLPNGSGFDVYKVSANTIRAAMYYSTKMEEPVCDTCKGDGEINSSELNLTGECGHCK